MSTNKRFGLGKGLGALIPEQIDNNTDTNEKPSSNLIDINLIKANDKQPRKVFDEAQLAQLSQSIKEYGILQPLILQKDGNTYTIIAGERRWRAAKQAKLKEVPAIVMDRSTKEILEISLIENIQRQDLNPIEEAQAYKRLIEDFSFTQEELSIKIGKSRTAITNCMRLLNLDEKVQSYIIEGVISEGHGRAILGLENKEYQFEIAQKIIDEGLSVRETESLVKKTNVNKNIKKNKDVIIENNPFINELRGKLENYFGTKVTLKHNNNKGKIEIEYYSTEDLQRIIETLNI
ncbi:ParB/RepB/Spo0J family partition protein [Clostridium sp. JN-9]|uniref:ParB/RepB/Spo0J family partition protein n=1 Tax=Clostridium sp. JN-9 TaxID=2507159 RepID=UPI001FA965CE|nr:ParB/RepB/Spo0J family partition protein [Clostridium sp. JN-9]